MEERVLNVSLGERSYGIRIGHGAAGCPSGPEKSFFSGKKVFLVSDSNTFPAHGGKAADFLRRAGAEQVGTFVFKAGEESKRIDTVLEICREAAQNGLDRKSILVALGGGVTGDMTGFAAAIYMRGIPFFQIPTTLLAMVDSSVGGKTGVDIPEGKNLIGAFHQPSGVLIDTDFLSTLPDCEYRCGMAEIIKTSAILDRNFFETIERNSGLIRARDNAFTAFMAARSCELKASIVAKDEKEGGIRAILNFGHTFGHAFECRSNYTLPHGEAVAIGMGMAADLALSHGIMKKSDAERLRNVILSTGLPAAPPCAFDPEEILSTLMKDKKISGGVPKFVLTPEIGRAEIHSFSVKEILSGLERIIRSS